MAKVLNVGDNVELCNSTSNIKKMRIGFGKLKDARLVLILVFLELKITNVSPSIMFDSFT